MLGVPRVGVAAAEAGAVVQVAAPAEPVLEGGLSKNQRALVNAFEPKMQIIG